MRIPKVAMIRRKNTLQARVGGRPGLSGEVSKKSLAAMEAALGDTARKLSGQLDHAVRHLREKARPGTDDWPKPFYLGAHDIRGIAETCGFGLLGGIAHDLCLYLEALPAPERASEGLLEAYADALVSALGDGATPSEVGRELQGELRRLAIDDVKRLGA